MSTGRPATAAGCELSAVVGLGSNLGDRLVTLRGAVRALAELGPVTAVSPLYETDAAYAPGPPYLNAAMRLGWNGRAPALLAALLSIEERFGRVRRERYGPRTLDLDVLWVEGLLLELPELVIPHPRLLERRFALGPLLDVAPDARHPSTGISLAVGLPLLSAAGVKRVAEADWADARDSVL